MKLLGDGRTHHAHELAESILWKWLHYWKTFTSSMQSHQNSNSITHWDRKVNPKVHMEAQNASNCHSNPEQKRTTLDISLHVISEYTTEQLQ
jgi:hypothetical protein